MLDQVKEFIAQVDAYCSRLGISVSAYGEMVMNDRSFVHQVKSGERCPSMRTISKNLRYMAENPSAEIAAIPAKRGAA